MNERRSDLFWLWGLGLLLSLFWIGVCLGLRWGWLP